MLDYQDSSPTGEGSDGTWRAHFRGFRPDGAGAGASREAQQDDLARG